MCHSIIIIPTERGGACRRQVSVIVVAVGRGDDTCLGKGLGGFDNMRFSFAKPDADPTNRPSMEVDSKHVEQAPVSARRVSYGLGRVLRYTRPARILAAVTGRWNTEPTQVTYALAV